MTESGFGEMIRSTMMAMMAMKCFTDKDAFRSSNNAELFEHRERHEGRPYDERPLMHYLLDVDILFQNAAFAALERFSDQVDDDTIGKFAQVGQGLVARGAVLVSVRSDDEGGLVHLPFIATPCIANPHLHRLMLNHIYRRCQDYNVYITRYTKNPFPLCFLSSMRAYVGAQGTNYSSSVMRSSL